MGNKIKIIFVSCLQRLAIYNTYFLHMMEKINFQITKCWDEDFNLKGQTSHNPKQRQNAKKDEDKNKKFNDEWNAEEYVSQSDLRKYGLSCLSEFFCMKD